MDTTRSMLVLALAAALAVAGCDQKSGGPTVASATATPAAAPSCPAGATVAGNACKASGQARVAVVTWVGAVTDSGPTLTVKNTSGFGLKSATVSLWFYDRTGHRLDVAGAKKYSSSADVLGSSTFAAGAQKDTTFNFMKANIPTGTAEIEGEIVAASLVKSDGTEGLTWKNDDLNADERAMAGTPPPGAAAPPQYAGGPAAPTGPGAPPTAATGPRPTPTGGGAPTAHGGTTGGKPGGPTPPHR
jgi:hypothetical protein